jgi:hypothetical protein
MSPASRHHTRVKMLDSTTHDGGRVPTYGHHIGKKTTNWYHPSTVSFLVSSSHKNETNPKHIFSLFQACVKMKPTPSIVYFLVSSSCKNETNPEQSFSLCFKLMKKMKPTPSTVSFIVSSLLKNEEDTLSLVFVLSRANKYMIISYRVYFYHFFGLVKTI